eukprot:TRINITY_DN5775_c0_g2_i2.p1 TRINITY_DN5775_c0_g2~~TRINITY_DN5775_c0_g2_i2.p1  ORF type:complete len:441 (+),score=222.28 TRINITY_DN5775_c0_g2_i2:190-1323(+)
MADAKLVASAAEDRLGFLLRKVEMAKTKEAMSSAKLKDMRMMVKKLVGELKVAVDNEVLAKEREKVAFLGQKHAMERVGELEKELQEQKMSADQGLAGARSKIGFLQRDLERVKEKEKAAREEVASMKKLVEQSEKETAVAKAEAQLAEEKVKGSLLKDEEREKNEKMERSRLQFLAAEVERLRAREAKAKAEGKKELEGVKVKLTASRDEMKALKVLVEKTEKEKLEAISTAAAAEERVEQLLKKQEEMKKVMTGEKIRADFLIREVQKLRGSEEEMKEEVESAKKNEKTAIKAADEAKERLRLLLEKQQQGWQANGGEGATGLQPQKKGESISERVRFLLREVERVKEREVSKRMELKEVRSLLVRLQQALHNKE